LLTFASGEIYLRSEGQWKDARPQSEGTFRAGHAYLSRDGGFYFIANDLAQSDPLLRWTSGTWEPIEIPEYLKEQTDLEVFIHPRQGLWFRSTQESYCLLDRKVMSCPELPTEWSGLTKFSIDEQGNVWAFDLDEVFVQKPGKVWESVAVPHKNTDLFSYSYIVDRHAHLWMIVQDRAESSERIHSIMRIDGASTQTYPELVRAVYESGVTPRDFGLDADFTAQLSNFTWSEESQSWIPHPLLKDITDHVVNIEFWNATEKVWYTRENKTYFEHQGALKHLPFPMSGEKPFVTKAQDIWTYGVATMNHYQWSPWIEMNSELDDLQNILDIWESQGQRLRICTHSGKVWELQEGSWSVLLDIRAYDEALTVGCFEDSQSNIFMRTEKAIWVLPVGQSRPKELSSTPKEQGPEVFYEDSKKTVWFACVNSQGIPTICAFQSQQLLTFPLSVERFDPYSTELCNFEIENDLYFLGGNFATVFVGWDRKARSLSNRSIRFPDGTELTVAGCTRVGASSVMIRSGEQYHLFQESDRILKPIDILSGGLSNVIRQVRSKDGSIYLSNDEGRDATHPAKTISEQILQGNVMRIEADGNIKLILNRAVRIQAFDEQMSFPLRFFMDRNGTLWSIALDYSLWTFRLIQFFEPSSSIRSEGSLRPD
jgi:hypothetical protein